MTTGDARRFHYAPVLTATVLTVLMLWLVGSVAGVLMLLFIGILLALYLNALAGWLERRVRVPARLAFPAALFGSLAMLALLFAIIVPPVLSQTQQLLQVLPDYLKAWEAWFDRIVTGIPGLRQIIGPQNAVVAALYGQLTSQLQNVVPRVFAGVQVAIDVFAVGVTALYLAISPQLYVNLVASLFPPVRRAFVRHVLDELGDILRAYIVGQLTTMTVLGLLTAVLLYFLSVPYALTFGVFTGLVAIVPFFGTLLSTILPALFVLNTPSGGVRALLVIGVGVVVHLVEGNIVSPMVMSKKVELPPVVSILGVLVMGKLLGPVGLLVALPTLCVVRVLVQRIVIHGIYEGGVAAMSAVPLAAPARPPAETSTSPR